MTGAFMTPWELRGYLAYPSKRNEPAISGTREYNNYRCGWLRAQREAEGEKSQYHLHLENVSNREQKSFAF